MSSRKQITIEKAKLFLVEGKDAYYFFIWACRAFNINDIQVVDFGGIDDFSSFLETLKGISGYEGVSTILIARDAENNAEGAVKSIKTALKKNRFVVPVRPFEFAEGTPRVAFIILPGHSSGSGGNSLLQGTLEDLCLSMTKDDVIHSCVELYVECLKSKGVTLKHIHKTRLHTYLAGKNDFAGLKVGEAAKAGAWDWNNASFKKMKKIIQEM